MVEGSHTIDTTACGTDRQHPHLVQTTYAHSCYSKATGQAGRQKISLSISAHFAGSLKEPVCEENSVVACSRFMR